MKQSNFIISFLIVNTVLSLAQAQPSNEKTRKPDSQSLQLVERTSLGIEGSPRLSKVIDWELHVVCYVSSYAQAGSGYALSQQCFHLSDDNKAIKVSK